MAPKIINFESPAKKETPTKKETPAKKDLFRVQKSKLNNAKTGIFLGRSVKAKNYLLTGSKKKLKTPDIIVCNTDRLYSKAMQYKELKEPATCEGLSLHEILYWEMLGRLQYREKATKAKAEAKAILSLQK